MTDMESEPKHVSTSYGFAGQFEGLRPAQPSNYHYHHHHQQQQQQQQQEQHHHHHHGHHHTSYNQNELQNIEHLHQPSYHHQDSVTSASSNCMINSPESISNGLYSHQRLTNEMAHPQRCDPIPERWSSHSAASTLLPAHYSPLTSYVDSTTNQPELSVHLSGFEEISMQSTSTSREFYSNSTTDYNYQQFYGRSAWQPVSIASCNETSGHYATSCYSSYYTDAQPGQHHLFHGGSPLQDRNNQQQENIKNAEPGYYDTSDKTQYLQTKPGGGGGGQEASEKSGAENSAMYSNWQVAHYCRSDLPQTDDHGTLCSDSVLSQAPDKLELSQHQNNPTSWTDVVHPAAASIERPSPLEPVNYLPGSVANPGWPGEPPQSEVEEEKSESNGKPIKANHQSKLATAKSNDVLKTTTKNATDTAATLSSPKTTKQIDNPVGGNASSLTTSQRTNQCEVCGRNYARPSTLKTHLRTHTNERPFKCNVCLKTFSQAANLTAHQRVHTGERPFSCPICGRQFSQSSSVITHLRTHSGERPYRCNMCSRTFSDSSTLTKHCRIHSGEKPYQCEYCPLNFSQSGNLSRHLKLHLISTTVACNSSSSNGSTSCSAPSP